MAQLSSIIWQYTLPHNATLIACEIRFKMFIKKYNKVANSTSWVINSLACTK